MAELAAGSVERTSRRPDASALARLRHRTEELIRRQPIVALVIAGAAGLIVGRLLRGVIKRAEERRQGRRRRSLRR